MDAAWHADPTTRHELRYHDGNAWTEHVATGGNQTADHDGALLANSPPPAPPVTPEPEPALEPVPEPEPAAPMRQPAFEPEPVSPVAPVAEGPARPFAFDGTAGTYAPVALAIAVTSAFLLTILTLGLLIPAQITWYQRWKARHTTFAGRRLAFIGRAGSLLPTWIKWELLMVVTLGLYGFWLQPKLMTWIIENTVFDDEAHLYPVPERRSVSVFLQDSIRIARGWTWSGFVAGTKQMWTRARTATTVFLKETLPSWWRATASTAEDLKDRSRRK